MTETDLLSLQLQSVSGADHISYFFYSCNLDFNLMTFIHDLDL